VGLCRAHVSVEPHTRGPVWQNASARNPERAEVSGYFLAWVTFLIALSASGFFGGVAGGLFAIN